MPEETSQKPQIDDYRALLKEEFETRRRKNGSYSLRAFSRDIGVQPSQVSDIFQCRKALSARSAYLVAQKLGMNPADAEYFSTLVQLEAESNPDMRATLLDKLRKLKPRKTIVDLSVDHFKSIADWYHLPIFELAQMPKFKMTPEAIATHLGITRIEAELALERLIRLGRLERRADGKVTQTDENIIFRSKEGHSALRKFHQKMLQKASEAIDEQPTTERFVGSETFCLDPKQLPELKALIDTFLTELAELAKKSTRPTEIYHSDVVLFRLTQKKEKK